MVAKKTAVATAPAPAPVAPVKEATKPKAVKAKAVAESPAPAPTPAKVEEAPVVEEAAAEAESPLDAVFAKMTAALALFKEIQTSLKALQKSYDRMKKVVDKQEKKKANARSTPSGFAKPTKISDELCGFLGVPKGTQMSRTEVTRSINAYVKERNLYDASNKRIILPDDKMKKILTLAPGEVLSFFTLQRSIKHHFASSVKA